MLRSAHFSPAPMARVALALAALSAAAQPPRFVREGDRWRREFYGVAPAMKRLRINAHGPVTLQAGTGNSFSYRVSVTVRARTESEAASVLRRYTVKVDTAG